MLLPPFSIVAFRLMLSPFGAVLLTIVCLLTISLLIALQLDLANREAEGPRDRIDPREVALGDRVMGEGNRGSSTITVNRLSNMVSSCEFVFSLSAFFVKVIDPLCETFENGANRFTEEQALFEFVLDNQNKLS